MSILLTIHQQSAGTVTISQEGLYTVLEARAPEAEGFVRLWAHGGGKSAYLGLMQPTESGLVLRRRLSRRELAAFPQPIETVSDREQDAEDSHKIVANNEINITNDIQQAVSEESAVISREAGESTRETNTANGLHKNETDCRSCPWPAELPEEGLLWYSRADGSLTAFDGISSLLALPAELRAPDARAVERVIEGRRYLIFRY